MHASVCWLRVRFVFLVLARACTCGAMDGTQPNSARQIISSRSPRKCVVLHSKGGSLRPVHRSR